MFMRRQNRARFSLNEKGSSTIMAVMAVAAVGLLTVGSMYILGESARDSRGKQALRESAKLVHNQIISMLLSEQALQQTISNNPEMACMANNSCSAADAVSADTPGAFEVRALAANGEYVTSYIRPLKLYNEQGQLVYDPSASIIAERDRSGGTSYRLSPSGGGFTRSGHVCAPGGADCAFGFVLGWRVECSGGSCRPQLGASIVVADRLRSVINRERLGVDRVGAELLRSFARSCVEIGGQYDRNNDDCTRFALRETCPKGLHPAGQDEFGRLRCEPVRDVASQAIRAAVTCPEGQSISGFINGVPQCEGPGRASEVPVRIVADEPEPVAPPPTAGPTGPPPVSGVGEPATPPVAVTPPPVVETPAPPVAGPPVAVVDPPPPPPPVAVDPPVYVPPPYVPPVVDMPVYAGGGGFGIISIDEPIFYRPGYGVGGRPGVMER